MTFRNVIQLKIFTLFDNLPAELNLTRLFMNNVPLFGNKFFSRTTLKRVIFYSNNKHFVQTINPIQNETLLYEALIAPTKFCYIFIPNTVGDCSYVGKVDWIIPGIADSFRWRHCHARSLIVKLMK